MATRKTTVPVVTIHGMDWDAKVVVDFKSECRHYKTHGKDGEGRWVERCKECKTETVGENARVLGHSVVARASGRAEDLTTGVLTGDVQNFRQKSVRHDGRVVGAWTMTTPPEEVRL